MRRRPGVESPGAEAPERRVAQQEGRTDADHRPGRYRLWFSCRLRRRHGDPNQIEPHDEPRIAAAGWDVVGHILGRNSILPDPSALGVTTPITVQVGVMVFYGYLARSRANPGSYAVAVRGTNGFAEWVIDADFVPRGAEAWPGVKVEQGFWSIYDSLILVGLDGGQIGVKAADGVAKVVGGDGTATVCGHSLGSAARDLSQLRYRQAHRGAGERLSLCFAAHRRPGLGGKLRRHGLQLSARQLRPRRRALRAVQRVADLIFNPRRRHYLAARHGFGRRAVRHRLQPILICYCAMIDYVTTRKRFDAEDAAAWRCIIGAPAFSLNSQLTKALATAVNALGGAAQDIVQLIAVSAKAKGGHV